MSIGLIENHPKATVVIPVCDDLSNSEIDYVSFLQNRFLLNSKTEAILIRYSSKNVPSPSFSDHLHDKRIKYFELGNSNLAFALNTGLSNASGKYVFFLRPQDTLNAFSIKAITSWFNHQNASCGFAIYPRKSIGDNSGHSLYDRNPGHGVYSIDERPFVHQPDYNICVKNQHSANVLFRTDLPEQLVFLDYFIRLILKDSRVAICPKGLYTKNCIADNPHLEHAYYLFEPFISLFEAFFDPCTAPVPPVLQSLYISELNRKLLRDSLYPFHYSPEQFSVAQQRIVDLLNHVDVDIIANHPDITSYHKQYWLSQKKNLSAVVSVDGESVGILCDGKQVYNNSAGIEVRIVYLSNEKNTLRFCGHIKSPLFSYSIMPRLFVYDETKNGPLLHAPCLDQLEEISLFESSCSYLGCLHTRTSPLYAFEYKPQIKDSHSFRFFVCLDGSLVRTYNTFALHSGFSLPKFDSILRGNILVHYSPSLFSAKLLSPKESSAQIASNTQRYAILAKQAVKVNVKSLSDLRTYARALKRNLKSWLYSAKLLKPEDSSTQIASTTQQNAILVKHAEKASAKTVSDLRTSAVALKETSRVWLYYDLYTVRKDNGYYQFKNDFQHCDGVKRYYVYNRPLETIQDLFTEEERPWLVEFGSDSHKKLYLGAELILTGFYGYSPISPFCNEEYELFFDDIKTFRVVYLQHGVLHASLRKQNSVENYRADRVVISSYFEKENCQKNYHYREEDLICSGMARYDHIDPMRKASRKILFAPSWREYFTVKESASRWRVLKEYLLDSDYYRGFNAFLNSEELSHLLAEHDLVLELKLHPIISSMDNLFQFTSDRICYAQEEVHVEDYLLFITDYSSYVFDYAYLKRPILYYVPDYDQFRSGMGHYKSLDLPLDQAFGPVVFCAEDAVHELKAIIESNFQPSELYHHRMSKFFFDFNGDCAERTYKECLQLIKDTSPSLPNTFICE